MPEQQQSKLMIDTCLALLVQHKTIHAVSVVMTLIAVLLLLVFVLFNTQAYLWFAMLAAVLVLGIAQIYYAIRIGFDVLLLQQLVAATQPISMGLALLDNALRQLGLLAPAKAGREIEQRIAGSLRLFKIQTLLCLMQFIIIVSGVFLLLVSA